MKKWACVLLAAALLWAWAGADEGEIYGEFLYEIQPDGTAKITGYTDDLVTLIQIPETLDGYPVTAIGQGAFSDCPFLVDAAIPNRVTEVEPGAFRGCYSQRAFTLSQDHPALYLQDGVLFAREDGRLIAFPADLGRGGYFGFMLWLSKIFPFAEEHREYAIPQGTPGVEAWAFFGSRISEMYVPEGVTYIGAGAFAECDRLEAAYLPNGLLNIGEEAFSGCKMMTEAWIPESVTDIGSGAFAGCDRLTAVVAAGSYGENWCRENGVAYRVK